MVTLKKIIILIILFSNLFLFGNDFVLVKGGFFKMGDTFGDGDKDAKPVHLVYVKDFYISKYELSLGEFEEFVKNSNYQIETGAYIFIDNIWEFKEDASYQNPYFQQQKEYPVVAINFYDAINFCNWKSKNENLEPCYTIKDKNVACDFNKNGYRLPTEAEWEMASRGGNSKPQYRYSGGNDLNEVGWYRNNSNYQTHKIGSKKPNYLGLYDMSGNVWEFCFDWYSPYKNIVYFNPTGSKTGDFKILRGGSFYDDCKHAVQVSNRFSIKPTDRFYNVGVRVVRWKR